MAGCRIKSMGLVWWVHTPIIPAKKCDKKKMCMTKCIIKYPIMCGIANTVLFYTNIIVVIIILLFRKKKILKAIVAD